MAIPGLGPIDDGGAPSSGASLVKCPDCEREVSKAATSCPGCGRPAPFWGREEERAIKDRKARSAYHLALGCSLTALLLLGSCVVFWIVTPSRVQQAPTAAESQATNRRLFFENHAPDDLARGYIFKQVLKGAGQRCDSVQVAVMGDPGVWKVVCAPGYRYAFRFDSDGKVTSAVRLP